MERRSGPLTAIPKKGSRRVRVGDTESAWRIRKKPTCAQGAFRAPMKWAVQACTTEPGSVLIGNRVVSHPDNWVRPHQTSVTPAVVRDIVRRALVAG
ncbi:hypothetical protein DAT35_49160 [Vitiosangium sp. GDMCC 1.1324]|nr:hypothetical protein DAT35_49160 [Vitiosangium sp. GDMCC 1.1324]